MGILLLTCFIVCRLQNFYVFCKGIEILECTRNKLLLLLLEDKETLNLSRNRKKRYNGRDCLKIVGATAESLKGALRLN